MRIEKFEDGVSFFNNEDNEVAFYSILTDRITYYSNAYPEWKDVRCVSIPEEDERFISNIVKIYRKKIEEERLK